jgi:hypothetical protein
MNLKTFLTLFLLGTLVSCSIHYEKRFGEEEEVHEQAQSDLSPLMQTSMQKEIKLMLIKLNMIYYLGNLRNGEYTLFI